MSDTFSALPAHSLPHLEGRDPHARFPAPDEFSRPDASVNVAVAGDSGHSVDGATPLPSNDSEGFYQDAATNDNAADIPRSPASVPLLGGGLPHNHTTSDVSPLPSHVESSTAIYGRHTRRYFKVQFVDTVSPEYSCIEGFISVSYITRTITLVLALVFLFVASVLYISHLFSAFIALFSCTTVCF